MNSVSTVHDQPSSPPVPAWAGTLTPPPGPPRPPRARIGFRQTMLRLLREPFSRAALRQRRYAALNLLLAIPGFVFIALAVTAGFGLSLSFAGMLAGIPLLMAALLGARQLGALHRRLAGRLLGLRVEAPPPLRPRPGALGRVRARLTDPVGWRACAYLVLKLPLAALTAVAASCALVYGVPYLTFPIWWEILHVTGVVIQLPQWLAWWTADPLAVARQVHSLAVAFALVPIGPAVLLWVPSTVRGGNAADAKLIARLLGPPLPHRVRELEQSRARVVDDSAARLRRIERDLHDGAQAQMVAVAMKLGLALEKLGGTIAGAPSTAEVDLERALELVDAAHRSAKEAITELRDLARGIHPPVLDHGRVLGDDDPHGSALRLGHACDGSSTVTTVGPPDGLLICSRPSTARTRSASPARPPRASRRAPPVPSSVTRTRSSPKTWTASSSACRAPLCLATLASSSPAQK